MGLINLNSGIQSGSSIKLNFTGQDKKQKPLPLAIMCDVFGRKGNPEDILEVRDWKKASGHGFCTSMVANATCPEVEIRSFDVKMDTVCDVKEKQRLRALQVTDIVKRATEIKKANPDRPISINMSFSIDDGSAATAIQDCYPDNLADSRSKLVNKYLAGREEYTDLFNAMKEFLSYKDNRIYVAAGNDADNLNFLLLCDNNRVIGVHGTDVNGVTLPFFANNDLSKKGGRALYNVYERNNGSRFLIINNKEIDLPSGFGAEQEHDSSIQEKLNFITGKDHKGKSFSEVKNHLMAVRELIEKSGKEFQSLNEDQKNYLLSKKDQYIPVGWGIEDLKFHHLSDRGLFFNVDKEGKVYWSPDGNPPPNDAKVLGFMKGTSFAAPDAMMNDFVKILSEGENVSFTGNIKLGRKKNDLSQHHIAYSMKTKAF